MNIFLDSQIYDDSFPMFRDEIENSNDERIDIYIATIGGNVDAAIAMANYIQGVNESGKKDIHTQLLSNADSSGTILFLAPDKENRHIVGSSKMFIHEPRLMNMFDVTSTDAQKASNDLEMYSNRIADFYVSRIEGLTKEEAQALMSGERTLSAEDMRDYKIINDIQPSFSIAALKSKSNQLNMSLLGGKKKPFQTSALKQGDNEISAIHRGELAVKSELEQIGNIEALNGDFIIGKNKAKIVNNVIEALDPFEEKPADDEDVVDVAAAVAEAVEPIMDMVEAIMTKVDLISGQSSTHTPKKKGISNAAPHTEQVTARNESRERQKDNLKKRTDKVNAQLGKINIV